MNKFHLVECPICGKPLDKNDDIVVCHLCGAPYHRDCYISTGQCIFTDLHESNQEWVSPTKEKQNAQTANNLCSSCNHDNPELSLFCEYCGVSLNTKTPPIEQNKTSSIMNNATLLKNISPIFSNISPNEEIDSIPASDWNCFIGKNANYYLPHFKQLSSSKVKMLNWGAFFFDGWYFIYRKMYGIGILILILLSILYIPTVLILYERIVSSSIIYESTNLNIDLLTKVEFIFGIISFIIRLLCGIYANTIYKSHATKKIKNIKSKQSSQTEYVEMLAQSGSVNQKLIISIMVSYATIYVITMYISLLL